METTSPIEIKLNDLYKNGLEPNKGEEIYRRKYGIVKDSYKVVTHSITEENHIYALYGGKVDETRFYTTEGEWSRLWIKDCYILRNVVINS